MNDQWTAASTYDEFMGRWSRILAPHFVDWLDLPAGIDWLELGCGTGSLTAAICDRANPKSIVACDPAEPFITYAAAQLRDPRVTFVHAGADDFPLRDADGYASATSLLALNFFPSPESALRRMCAASNPTATVSACVWDYADGMQFLRLFWNAAVRVDRAARASDEGLRFPICTPANLLTLFADAGLQDLECEPLQVATLFRDFDDLWRPLTAGTGPAPAFVQKLGPNERERLRSTLHDSLPFASDGSVPLSARAWAIRGTIAAS